MKYNFLYYQTLLTPLSTNFFFNSFVISFFLSGVLQSKILRLTKLGSSKIDSALVTNLPFISAISSS